MTRHYLNPYWLIVFAFLLLPVSLLAQLQINTVTGNPSTCFNNGSITVDATTTAPPLLYSITGGPVTAPVQTSAVFNSLPAGTYTVTVSDGALNKTNRSVIVDGNYMQPDMAPLTTLPYCNGGSDGRLVGNLLPGTGYGPFNWQLIAPSPVTTLPQANDTFPNLPAGNYTLRLTDGCGGFRTVVTTLSEPPPANMIFQVPPHVYMVGCDSGMISMNLHADVLRLPLTCTFVTNAGTFTTRSPTLVDTTSGCCGYFTVEQLLPGFTYGDFVQVSISDSCGAVLSSPTYHSRPFVFCAQETYLFADCEYKTAMNFDLNIAACDAPGTIGTQLKSPVTYEVTDQFTNAVLERDTARGYVSNSGHQVVSGFTLKPLTTNKAYNISIKDSCGRNVILQFYVPVKATPVPQVSSTSIAPSACVDSAAFAFVFADNFKTQPQLILLSGPERMGSTKSGYAYENKYVYPDTMPVMGGGGISSRFDISNLSAGTYQFKVIDSCGSEVFDKLTILPTDVTDLKHEFTYKKGCLGKNELHYRIATVNGDMYVRNLTTGEERRKFYQSQDFTSAIHDSLTNLPSGAYEMIFTYAAIFGTTSPVNAIPISCQQIRDTIIIEGYKTPAITVNNYIQCKVNTYLEIIADSSKGVQPFEYEIISGPQTFPIQAGNIFATTTAGTYTARIYDVCGNASTSQITVSAITFPPVTSLSFACNSTRLTYGPSAYYTYRWKAPNGTVYTGDTLIVDPITPADTGIYTIEKATDINGCRDTSYTTYHLLMYNVHEQTVSICPGHSVTVGAHTYKSAGVYTDTLKSSHLCDSVVVTRLTVLPLKRDSIYHVICPGQQYTFHGRDYGVAGIYSDTLATATCDSVVTLLLTVNLKRDSINRSICANTSYPFNGRLLTVAGIYRDTLATATCDSIVVLNLSVLPLKRDTISKTICAGNVFEFNGQIISAAGIYRDTLGTLTCDSIVVLNLAVVAPAVQIAANPETILAGSNVQLQATGAGAYLWSGAGVVFSNVILQNPLATLDNSAWIYLSARSDPDDCLMKDSVFITVMDRGTFCADSYIYIPTAFTPNGDGLNDVFRIVAQKITLKSFRIFNRWGEQVFTTSDIATGWNGRYKGGMLPGSYVYMVTYTDCMGELKLAKGNIVILL